MLDDHRALVGAIKYFYEDAPALVKTLENYHEETAMNTNALAKELLREFKTWAEWPNWAEEFERKRQHVLNLQGIVDNTKKETTQSRTEKPTSWEAIIGGALLFYIIGLSIGLCCCGAKLKDVLIWLTTIYAAFWAILLLVHYAS